MHKTALKNTLYSKNESILNIGKNGLHAKAIAFAKWSVWVKKKKLPKTFKKRFYIYNIVILWKRPLSKTPNIGKMREFEYWQKWPPCKIISLRQKIKLPKTYQK